ncbi:uncharacterized protein [Argopecten irradians]|uniref:uncharacterized protein n=1 Tax=Argopecten irradians TaxID=31199 RepID=UPI003718141C
MDKDKGSSDTDERNDHGDTTTKDETEVKGTTTNSSGTSESTNSIQTEIRTSERNRKLTEKMAAYQETELEKRLAKLRSTYGKWQIHAKEIRTNLKAECSENDLGQMIDKIKALEASVLKNFNIVKDISTPAQDIVRRIDACVAVSADLLKILNERLSDIDTFDNVFEARRLSDLRRHAKSVFGESESSSSVSSSTSSRSRLSVKMAEAAADLEALRAAEQFNPIEERLQTDLKHLESKGGLSSLKRV